jgi:hypothetical protein
MNRQQFGKDLQVQLEKGYDIVRISRWGFQIYSSNCRNIDSEFYNAYLAWKMILNLNTLN